ncbi:hypothetical protein BZG01_17730 [Labilibaculum manganireducens]|uniref:Uncharacterized protein n=1 Tax=Labilibaculum manganireducens TaxID=1940525 RepID=A0A2N3HVT3_9BACT|nr:hypothetical protein BZG01_17730 [Labilibaculum manganireducens]
MGTSWVFFIDQLKSVYLKENNLFLNQLTGANPFHLQLGYQMNLFGFICCLITLKEEKKDTKKEKKVITEPGVG